MDNYYEILELKSDCSYDDIKSSYRLLCKKYHPDINNGDDTMFKKIHKAYEVLSDSDKRSDYDFELECGEGCSPNKVDIQHTLYVSLKDMYNGCEKKFRMNGKVHEIHISPQVIPGTQMILKGEGWNGGDLVLTIEAQKTDDLWIDGGMTIHMNKEIPWYDCILGTEFIVNVFGDDMKVKMRPYSKDGSEVLIIGGGYPINGKRRNMIVHIKSSFPKTLTSEQIDMIKRIKEIEEVSE